MNTTIKLQIEIAKQLQAAARQIAPAPMGLIGRVPRIARPTEIRDARNLIHAALARIDSLDVEPAQATGKDGHS